MLTNRASARYRLKAPTPGEMGPPLISRPAPSICVSSPGLWRPVTLFSESTAQKEDPRVTAQVSSFFTCCSRQQFPGQLNQLLYSSKQYNTINTWTVCLLILFSGPFSQKPLSSLQKQRERPKMRILFVHMPGCWQYGFSNCQKESKRNECWI